VHRLLLPLPLLLPLADWMTIALLLLPLLLLRRLRLWLRQNYYRRRRRRRRGGDHGVGVVDLTVIVGMMIARGRMTFFHLTIAFDAACPEDAR
jgi:hypothetical protein